MSPPALRLSAAEFAERQIARQHFRDGVCWLKAQAAARLTNMKGGQAKTETIFKERYPDSHRSLENLRARAAVPGITTGGAGAGLKPPSRVLLADFGLAVQDTDLLGQLASKGAHQIDPNSIIPSTDAPHIASASWVGEGLPFPFLRGDFKSTARLNTAKLQGGAALTQELATQTSDVAVSHFEKWLSGMVLGWTALALLDPSLDEVLDLRPASLTHAAHVIPSSGTDAAAVSADIKSLFAYFEDAGVPLRRPVLIMSRAVATALAWLDAAPGIPAFPNLGADGGSIRGGTPVLTSPQAGDQIVLVDADAVVFADDGLEAEITTEASVDLSDASVMSIDPPVGAPSLVSLWQTNSIGVATARWCYWSLLRPSVALISGVTPTMATEALGAA